MTIDPKAYNFAIIDDRSLKVVRPFKTEKSANSALRFWNKASEYFTVIPIYGLSA